MTTQLERKLEIAIVSPGLHGHVNPVLPLVSELVGRGHAVTYYAPKAFRSRIESQGASFFPYESVYMDPVPGLSRVYGISTMPARLVRELRHALPQLIEPLAGTRPDVVLYDMFGLAGKAAARLLGIPAARLSPTYVMNESFPLVPEAVWSADSIAYFREHAQTFTREWSLPAPELIDAFHDTAPLNLVFVPRELQPFGETFDERFLFVGSSKTWGARPLKAEEPLLYISLGTLFNDRADFFANCFEALRDGAWRVILSAGHQVPEELLASAPPNFQVYRHVHQLEVLSRTSVFLTHGGMNSTLEGLSLGVPLVLFPQMFEQEVNARRVEELGAGLRLEAPLPCAKEIRDTVDRALRDPRLKARAEWLAECNRSAPGKVGAATAIERYASNQPQEPRLAARGEKR